MRTKALYPIVLTDSSGNKTGYIKPFTVTVIKDNTHLPFFNCTEKSPEMSFLKEIALLSTNWRLAVKPSVNELSRTEGLFVHPAEKDFNDTRDACKNEKNWDFGQSWNLAGIIQYLLESGRKPSEIFEHYKNILFTGKIRTQEGLYKIKEVGGLVEKIGAFLKNEEGINLFVVPYESYNEARAEISVKYHNNKDNKQYELRDLQKIKNDFFNNSKNGIKTILLLQENQLQELVDLLFVSNNSIQTNNQSDYKPSFDIFVKIKEWNEKYPDIADIKKYFKNKQNIESLKILATNGSADAQYYLGVCHYCGFGLPRDYHLAIKCFLKSAEQGNLFSESMLGKCYGQGKGVSQNYIEAAKWYRIAAEKGHSGAQNNLGNLYFNGHGLSKDFDQAVKWYSKSADQGNSYAQHNLCGCYYKGLGVKRNKSEAFRYHRLAFEQKNEFAQIWLNTLRFKSASIDFIVYILPVFVLWVFLSTELFLIVAPLMLTVIIYKDFFRGQSVGKRIFHLQVVNNKSNGTAGSLGLMLRNATLIAYPYLHFSLCVIEGIIILFGIKRLKRRMGDCLTGTKVILYDKDRICQKKRPPKVIITLLVIFSLYFTTIDFQFTMIKDSCSSLFNNIFISYDRCLDFGEKYLQGDGVFQDRKKAMEIFKLVCKAGENRACEKLVNSSENMTLIPSGNFIMGCNSSNKGFCDKDSNFESISRTVNLPEYMIDRYEVTNYEYSKCVEAGFCIKPSYDNNLCFSKTESFHFKPMVVPAQFRGAKNPVVCVNWFEAKNYCVWAGKRLPSEEEWEKAARGTTGKELPWGSNFRVLTDILDYTPWSLPEASCDNVVMYDWRFASPGCGNDGTMPVGSKPGGASAYGVYDMIGNVWEWVESKDDSTKNSPEDSKNKLQIYRGRSWNDSWRGSINRYSRGSGDPEERYTTLGFRCAGNVLKKGYDNWSEKSPRTLTWSQANDYCMNLNEKEYSNWRVPTISELRTLIKYCPETMPEGNCTIKDDCLSWECRNDDCSDCSIDNNKRSSELGDTDIFWSFSELSDYTDYVWVVNFINGSIEDGSKKSQYGVRCVR